jgi:ribosomal protein S18 acetylase RimI-like enzyme
MITNNLTDVIVLPGAPAIPGLTFRRFRGEADYPKMFAVLQGSKDADQIEEVDTLEALTSSYAHLVNCSPYQDMLFVKVEGNVVGYARVFWQEALDVGRLYIHEGFLLPQWRGRGIGRAMLRYNERRLCEIATEHPQGKSRFFEVLASSTETAKSRLLEREGYAPVRYFLEMVRPDLDNIPDCPLPPGLEVRPVRPEHYRAIWEANEEAFRDHWSHVPYSEEDYEYWLHGDPEFQPDMWTVAWDVESNQVAGMVLGFILEEQNAKFNRKRGWTADICVRRPWRKRGLAHALIAENLRAIKARGMAEAALSADAENLSGALRLYESMGFRTLKRDAVYRKPMK